MDDISKYPIRVLHVVHGMDCGGTENMIMNYYRHIDRSKIQFDFLVHTNDECYFDKEILTLGGRIFHAPYYKIFNTFEYQGWLKKFFKEYPEIKIVHGHLGSCAHLYLKIAKKHGCFAIAHAHNTKPKFSYKSIPYRFFTYKVRNIADYFFGCSKDALMYRYGVKITNDKNKSSVMVNAIDISSYACNSETRKQIAKEFNIKDNEIVVGHVGRFCEQKNHSFLINIFYELTKKDDKYKLMLVGDGPLKHKIEDKCRKLGIYDNVIFTGVRNDVNRLMQRMDVFLFPSFYEGLGIVLIEAQAASIPCFVADVISNEVKLSNLINFISLSKSAKFWSNIIYNYKMQIQKEEIPKSLSMYEIGICAKILYMFYYAIVNDNKHLKE